MIRDRDRGTQYGESGGPGQGGGSPGRRTLTQLLRRPDQPSELAGAPAVQALGGDLQGDAIQDVAAQGVMGVGGAMPWFDQIQGSFGRHDVSGIQAHVGGAAAQASQAIGAQAYATGNSVAFAGTPDLHTAAHEAAHVVQQRGGIHLKGGVGEAGDPYERHADAVADKVVQGGSAEALLDQHAGTPAAGGAVQRQQSASGSPVVQRLTAAEATPFVPTAKVWSTRMAEDKHKATAGATEAEGRAKLKSRPDSKRLNTIINISDAEAKAEIKAFLLASPASDKPTLEAEHQLSKPYPTATAYVDRKHEAKLPGVADAAKVHVASATVSMSFSLGAEGAVPKLQLYHLASTDQTLPPWGVPDDDRVTAWEAGKARDAAAAVAAQEASAKAAVRATNEPKFMAVFPGLESPAGLVAYLGRPPIGEQCTVISSKVGELTDDIVASLDIPGITTKAEVVRLSDAAATARTEKAKLSRDKKKNKTKKPAGDEEAGEGGSDSGTGLDASTTKPPDPGTTTTTKPPDPGTTTTTKPPDPGTTTTTKPPKQVNSGPATSIDNAPPGLIAWAVGGFMAKLGWV